MNNTEHVICPCCGATVLKGRFCPECGSPLEKTDKTDIPDEVLKKNSQDNSFPQIGAPYLFVDSSKSSDNSIFSIVDPNHHEDLPEPESEALDDTGLTLIADFCKKTVATIGGDGYDETVLFKNEADGSFQIHTYSKYQYMKKEIHHSYATKEGAAEAVLALIDELRLEEYEGKRGVGLCGGMYVCKFQKDGVMHRVSTDNLGTDGSGIITRVGKLLGSYIGEELKK